MKMARCIIELERIYGIKHGNNQRTGNNFASSKTQADLANKSQIDQSQLINYKKLIELIPELQSLVEIGALNCLKKYEKILHKIV